MHPLTINTNGHGDTFTTSLAVFYVRSSTRTHDGQTDATRDTKTRLN